MVSVKHINLYRTACKLERHCEADQEVDDNTRLVRFMSEVFTFVLETKVREDYNHGGDPYWDFLLVEKTLKRHSHLRHYAGPNILIQRLK